MRDVVVIGAGMTRFGESWDKSIKDIFVEAALGAIGDAGVDHIDSLYVGAMSSGLFVGQEHLGAVMADSSGYPDCRPEFYDAMNEAIRRGTKEGSGIVVKAPFVHLLKKDIVLMGKSMGVPFEQSWSCYREGEKACGVCDSCALRLRAFAEAGVPDPLPYEDPAFPC